MTIHHHPDDELLLTLAAGQLSRGAALVVGVHLESCDTCRRTLLQFEAAAGALLESIEPVELAPDALAKTLSAIDSLPVSARVRPKAPLPTRRPALPAGVAWPRSLAQCQASGWRWMGPGLRWSRLRLPDDPKAKLFLLRIQHGMNLAWHTHSGVELTQVLCGSFDDGRGQFGPGDFDAADASVHHQPVVQPGGECICLASIEGRVRFDGALASLLGSAIGM
jgi:putative transcriptional regulator